MEKSEEGYLASQASHAMTLGDFSLGATYDKLRTVRYKLVWLSITRPDVCYLADMASQATKECVLQNSLSN